MTYFRCFFFYKIELKTLTSPFKGLFDGFPLLIIARNIVDFLFRQIKLHALWVLQNYRKRNILETTIDLSDVEIVGVIVDGHVRDAIFTHLKMVRESRKRKRITSITSNVKYLWEKYTELKPNQCELVKLKFSAEIYHGPLICINFH